MADTTKIIVTGSAGFIGSNLLEKLIEDKYSVIAIDNLSTGKEENLNTIINDIEFICDNVEAHNYEQHKNVKAVIHLAAQASVPLSIKNFETSSKSNMIGTIRLIEFCRLREIPFIYASSSAIYGGIEVGDDSSSDYDLLSPYSVDKIAMEMYAKVANHLYGLASIGLRFFNVYGPRQDPSSQYSGVISIFVNNLLRKKPIVINGGYQTRDFIFVGDVVESIKQSLLYSLEACVCEQVNILTGNVTSIDSLADILIKKIDVDAEKIYKDLPAGDPVHSNGTCDKMKNILNINLKELTSLKTGLTKTIDFIRSNSL